MTNLNGIELRDLISRYESELRKLSYQYNKVKDTIAELKGDNKPQKAIEKVAVIPKVEPVLKKPEVKEIKSIPIPIPKKAKSKEIPPQAKSGVYTGTFSYSNVVQKKKVKKPSILTIGGGVSVVEAITNYDEFDLDDNGKGYRLSEWDKFILESLFKKLLTHR